MSVIFAPSSWMTQHTDLQQHLSLQVQTQRPSGQSSKRPTVVLVELDGSKTREFFRLFGRRHWNAHTSTNPSGVLHMSELSSRGECRRVSDSLKASLPTS